MYIYKCYYFIFVFFFVDFIKILNYEKKKFEFFRFVMGKILGEGVFGVVIKVDVYGIFGKNGVVIVVVKMLKGRIV